jgi:ribosomal protein L29
MAEESKDVAFTMSPEELSAYREELKQELMDLEHSQSLHPTDYKYSRIKRIRQRLSTGIETT